MFVPPTELYGEIFSVLKLKVLLRVETRWRSGKKARHRALIKGEFH